MKVVEDVEDRKDVASVSHGEHVVHSRADAETFDGAGEEATTASVHEDIVVGAVAADLMPTGFWVTFHRHLSNDVDHLGGL